MRKGEAVKVRLRKNVGKGERRMTPALPRVSLPALTVTLQQKSWQVARL